MDFFTVTAYVVACFIFYRIINFTVKSLKILILNVYPSNPEDLPSLPIIGHAYLFVGDTEKLYKRGTGLVEIYPTTIRLSFGSSITYFTVFPKHVKEILCSPKTIEKSFVYQSGRPWLGDGLVTAPASLWEVHRKLLQPSFNSMVLKSFIETFSTQSVLLAKKLEQHVDGPEFEIYRPISLCTLDVICATAMGVNLEAQDREFCQYEESAHELFFGIAMRFLRPWLYPDFIFYRTQLGRDHIKHLKFMQAFADNVVQEKKAKILQGSDQRVSVNNEQDAADTSVPERQLLIDDLLRISSENKTLTDKMVRDHVNTIVVAGSDTAANQLNFLMLMLASHQDIQEKVYQELCDIFGEHVLDDESEELHFTMEVLARMTYMERVIKETMRLFPIAPAVGREATDDLDLGDRTLPKGSSVLIIIPGIHRNEKYWPDPLKFDPDRFLPDRFAKQEPYSYLPFSGGRRNCIGWKYGMMMMKIIAATILRKYVVTKDKVVKVEDIRLKFDTLLKPVEPITIRIKRRVK